MSSSKLKDAFMVLHKYRYCRDKIKITKQVLKELGIDKKPYDLYITGMVSKDKHGHYYIKLGDSINLVTYLHFN